MKTPEKPNPDSVIFIEIDERNQDQRLDNFLAVLCKGVPKSHLFRIIRSGEVRINRKRAQAKTKLCLGDQVRIPPIQVKEVQTLFLNDAQHCSNKASLLQAAAGIPILFEDDYFLALNKPSGMAVHGGSGSSFGLIECIRALRAETHQDLELVHRIDRETSGILIVSKKRSALRHLQEQLRSRSWKKYYQSLVVGQWPASLQQVNLPLLKVQASEKEQRVFVDEKGDTACTKFSIIQRYTLNKLDLTFIQAQILTGRTHQIRVHSSASHCPIAGDDRYGNFEINRQLAKQGLKRMFLHAVCLHLTHPHTHERLVLEAPLPVQLKLFLKSLQTVSNK